MLSREIQFKKDYSDIVAAFQATFSTIAPPDASWIFLWLGRHEIASILSAIRTLGQHPLKVQFSTASTGKAISSLLRQDALKRAAADLKSLGGRS